MTQSLNDIIVKAIYETSNDAIGVSKSGVHTMVNPSYVKLFGYTSDADINGRPILDFIASSEHARIQNYVCRRNREEQVPPSYETIGKRKDGTTFPMDVQVSSYPFKGEIYTLVILRDISAQRKAEQDLREGQDFYKSLFEENSAIKIILDPETGCLVNANSAACEFYGYTMEELIGKPIWEINTLDEATIRTALQNTLNQKVSFFTFKHRLASGEFRDVDIYSGPVQMRGKNLLLSIIHDVTERSRLQEQLLKSQKMEAIGKLAGGIAHDFNNLITAIFAHADFIVEAELSRAEVISNAKQIIEAGKRAEGLVTQLLAFSRGQLLQPRLLKLNDIVSGLEQLLSRVIGEDIALEISLDPTVGNVRVDCGQIEQVILNLVINAREAMKNGGKLKLATVQRTLGNRVEACLTLCDNGPGIPKKYLDKVFDPYFTTKPSGSGLGLSTAYGIAKQSNGSLDVASELGKGTTFTLRLPMIEGIHESIERGVPTNDERPSISATILFAEDDEIVRKSMATALRASGCRVIECEDGVAGLEAFRQNRDSIDMIISDVRMPRKSGYEMVTQINEERPGLQTVFISGYTDIQNIPSFSGLQPRVLKKPFRAKDLIKLINELLLKKL